MKKLEISYNELYKLYYLDCLPLNQICQILHCCRAALNFQLKKHNIPKRERMASKDYSGKKYNQLLVLYMLPREKGKSYALCRCDCGKELKLRIDSLVDKNTTSCGCKKINSQYKGYKDLSGAYWNKVKNGAKDRNIEFNITIEYAWKLFEKQNKKCALTGRDISLYRQTSIDWSTHTASIDRIDSKKGYIEGNIQWVHKDVNRMKWSLTLEEFIKICHEVTHIHPIS